MCVNERGAAGDDVIAELSVPLLLAHHQALAIVIA